MCTPGLHVCNKVNITVLIDNSFNRATDLCTGYYAALVANA